MNKIPFYTLSGFLGSGKTTFLQRILNAENPPYKRIAVVENDFAPLGVDAALLPEKDNYRVLEINNGSVFCVCLLGGFVSSLSKFIEQHSPDCVILEASGLSWPLSIINLMEKGDLATKIYPAAEICIVDARTFAGRRKVFGQVEQSISYADTVILNKCDLCSETEIAAAKAEISKLNPFCTVFETSYSDVDVNTVLLNPNRTPEDSKRTAKGSLCSPENIESKVFSSAKILPAARKDEFLALASKCIRAKGFFNCSDGKRYMLQCASGISQAIPTEKKSAMSQIVFIGDNVKDLDLSAFFE